MTKPKLSGTTIGTEELEHRLWTYEAKYGIPSKDLSSAFRNGVLEETAEFRDWSLLYSAYKSVAGGSAS